MLLVYGIAKLENGGDVRPMIDIEELKDSKQFLNILLKHIDTAVFIADENLRIHQFNDSFLKLFALSDQKASLVDTTFGSASGCINRFKENLSCGETSACEFCAIRKSLLHVLKSGEPAKKQYIERVFYIDSKPEKKIFEFTTQPVSFKHRKMILVFVYDVTRIELSKLALEEKQRQIDIDLKKAGQIQKHLLPSNVPDMPSIKAHWFFEPCLTVGGDIFHIYKEDDEHVSAYILDVCGHGVSAALIAVTVKQFLDQMHAKALETKEPTEPGRILDALENEFPFERFDCYFTIVYALINIRTGALSYGCAGHVPPVITGNQGRFTVLKQHGTVIGLGREENFSQYTTRLHPGDKLILYTDGLIDYFGEKGALENKNHFYASLKEKAALPAEQIVTGIITDQKNFQGCRTADDDITLLIIEYTGQMS